MLIRALHIDPFPGILRTDDRRIENAFDNTPGGAVFEDQPCRTIHFQTVRAHGCLLKLNHSTRVNTSGIPRPERQHPYGNADISPANEALTRFVIHV